MTASPNVYEPRSTCGWFETFQSTRKIQARIRKRPEALLRQASCCCFGVIPVEAYVQLIQLGGTISIKHKEGLQRVQGRYNISKDLILIIQLLLTMLYGGCNGSELPMHPVIVITGFLLGSAISYLCMTGIFCFT